MNFSAGLRIVYHCSPELTLASGATALGSVMAQSWRGEKNSNGAGDSVYRDTGLSPATAGCGLSVRGSWGFATLHPRLYAVARYRGLAENLCYHRSEKLEDRVVEIRRS